MKAGQILGFLSSLKLAVFNLVGIAAAVAAGTFVESLYDTPTAQYWVYHSIWFPLLLGSMGLNIFSVMVSRWPWKPRHVPFLCAHIGILMLLFGSWITQRYGLDGNLRVTEGETASAVELDTHLLVLSDNSGVQTLPIQWLPPGVGFKPISTLKAGLPYDLTVQKFLPHAEPIYNFVPNEMKTKDVQPAVHLKLEGGPMRITQDFWLWQKDPAWASVQAGPALLAIGRDGEKVPGRPSFTVKREPDGKIAYRAYSSTGELVQGKLAPKDARNKAIDLKWKGGVALTLLEWIEDATVSTTYKEAKMQYGQMAPPPAILVTTGSGKDLSEVWLGLGERALLHTGNGKDVEVGYMPKRVILPFGIRLDRFTIEHDPGTRNPSSFASRVSVIGGPRNDELRKDVIISMNEPLRQDGITLYQASYEEGEPRPKTSILSVNHDPGRLLKYLGSLLIVFGSILLFTVKWIQKRKGARA